MAEFCGFCGEELRRFGKDSLECGGVTQPVCKACWKQYISTPQIERCQALLKGSWAVEPEQVRAFLERKERARAAEQARQERLGQVMNCCGQPMTCLGVSMFQLGRQSWLLGDLPNLLSGAMELAVFRCEHCGQIKFMDPEFMN